MKFCSTRNEKLSLPLAQAILEPLAPDGGLFVPREDVDLRSYLYPMDEDTSFSELVSILAPAIFRDAATPELLRRLEATAGILDPQLREADASLSLLELYHGPGAAFQDFSLSFLADLLAVLKPPERKVCFLIPTAGDTGNAAARAFAGRPDIRVVLLKPATPGPAQRPVSAPPPNVLSLQVEGGFEDCVSLAREAFSSPELVRRYGLAAATSINPGRLLAQVFHFLYGFIRLKARAGDILYSMPSATYGNFASGLLAWRWGMPVSGFVCAGKGLSDLVGTDAWERISFLAAGDPAVLNSMIHSYEVDSRAQRSAMAAAWKNHGIWLDPATALAWAAARRAQKDFLEETGRLVVLATTHPGTWADQVEEACGSRPPDPPGTGLKVEGGRPISRKLSALEQAISNK